MKNTQEDLLKFIKICWENIQYQHEIMIDEDTWHLLYKIAKRENWNE